MTLKNTALVILAVSFILVGSAAMFAALIVALVIGSLFLLHDYVESEIKNNNMLKMETVSNEPGFMVDWNGELVDMEMIKLFSDIKNKITFCHSRNDLQYCFSCIEEFKNKFDYMPYSVVLWEDLMVEHASVSNKTI